MAYLKDSQLADLLHLLDEISAHLEIVRKNLSAISRPWPELPNGEGLSGEISAGIHAQAPQAGDPEAGVY
jgi:hypothetical protein